MRPLKRILSLARVVVVASLVSPNVVLAQPPTYTVSVAVVFTDSAAEDMASGNVWEGQAERDPNVFVTENFNRVNAGLSSGVNDLGDVVEYDPVDTQFGTLNDANGFPYHEQNVPYGQTLEYLRDHMDSVRVGNQSINSYLQSHAADVLVIVARNFVQGDNPGVADINVMLPNGTMTTKQIVIVDAAAAGLTGSPYRDTLLLHELLHNAGVFDRTGGTNSSPNPPECTIEMPPGYCGLNAIQTVEIRRNNNVGNLDCAWLDQLNRVREIAEEDNPFIFEMCDYLTSQGWGGNWDWLVEKGFPHVSTIAQRKFINYSGGGGGGGYPIVPSPPELFAVPHNCEPPPYPGYPPICEYEIYWYYDGWTEYVIFYNFYVQVFQGPAWWQPVNASPGFNPLHLTAVACSSLGVCSGHSLPMYMPY